MTLADTIANVKRAYPDMEPWRMDDLIQTITALANRPDRTCIYYDNSVYVQVRDMDHAGNLKHQYYDRYPGSYGGNAILMTEYMTAERNGELITSD